ncbi:hypothetical protein [Jiella mangrovi]|uniref:DUF3471 domain-containing protein n=1 Tax=Jiella mangrovi TaxID=2821407 RepID=A0ABS4BFH6_9HYPH|nr:hypothetical protein [Jiella mangrovi]MBP0615510.1 hypothetical protein [Jiella mangrovi]
MKTHIITAAAVFFASAASAGAGDLKPDRGHSIDLGPVSGAAYYTVEKDGLKVVATIAGGETATPVRFVSTLSDGQSVTIAVPALEGGETRELTFRRDGDHMVFEDGRDLRASLTD